uniref:Calmodulin n=1 Tax=Aceria tosichella TaxID=561515 RepID=A0A6G1SFP8_9ACAR
MARFFSEDEIDGFRDCFYLNSKSGIINDLDQLKFVMRSVGFSPTIEELETHLKQRSNSIKFADFLDCAHAQMQVEKIPDEILRAFRVSPFVRRDQNNITVDTLRHLLCNFGEKFSHKEFNALVKELNINKPEVSYSQFVNSLVANRHRQTPASK